LSKIVSLFVAHLSVLIYIWRGFKVNGSRQEKKKMAGSLVLDPLVSSRHAQAFSEPYRAIVTLETPCKTDI
jgi:hypothetical protein